MGPSFHTKFAKGYCPAPEIKILGVGVGDHGVVTIRFAHSRHDAMVWLITRM